MVSPSQTAASVEIFMIVVLPQTGQRQRTANGEAAPAQSQRASVCFMALPLWISSVVDSLIVARVATAGSFRTVRIGKCGARRDSLSLRAAPRDCNLTALGRSRYRSGGAKNNCSGKHKFYPHGHSCLLVPHSSRTLRRDMRAVVESRRPEIVHKLPSKLDG
jgi:hypothetical protein